MEIREKIVFCGRVQGVGFRYKLRWMADAYGVTGWVRNEYDGSVCAELQGLEESIDRILQELGQDRFIIIEDLWRKRVPLEDDERSFQIRH